MLFLKTHIHVLIYAGFWGSLSSYGLLAPPERMALLESRVITEGWHLTALAVLLGGPVGVLYAWRMRANGRDLTP